MGMFVQTANPVNHLLFADQGKQTSVSCFLGVPFSVYMCVYIYIYITENGFIDTLYI